MTSVSLMQSKTSTPTSALTIQALQHDPDTFKPIPSKPSGDICWQLPEWQRGTGCLERGDTRQLTQALGEHDRIKERIFSHQEQNSPRGVTHSPASVPSQSCGLHFCVLSGQGSWSQRLLSSSTCPVCVLMHFTWRRWMPPPQGAEHCGSRQSCQLGRQHQALGSFYAFIAPLPALVWKAVLFFYPCSLPLCKSCSHSATCCRRGCPANLGVGQMALTKLINFSSHGSDSTRNIFIYYFL